MIGSSPDIESTLWALAVAVGFFIAAAGITIVRRREGKSPGVFAIVFLGCAAFALFRAYGSYFS